MEERLWTGVWNGRVFPTALQLRNCTGDYTALSASAAEAAYAVAMQPFETGPGKQRQVDWEHLGSLCG